VAIAVAPVTPTTTPGVFAFVNVPLPSSPWAFTPQHSTVPLESSAHVSFWPAPIATAPASPWTGAGVGTMPVFAPLPS
jgi:hypothetical protein